MSRNPGWAAWPDGWSRPEPFRETLQLGASVLHLVGYSVRAPHGDIVTGSAAGRSPDQAPRAWAELGERMAVWTAARSAAPVYPTYDRRGHRVGELPRERVFPVSPEPQRYTYSLSNGVAAQRSWSEACDRAYYELVERDRLLRSWFGQLAPRPLGPSSWLAELLADSHDVQEVSFAPADARDPVCVVATFGFPRRSGLPVIRGSAAAADLDEARERSAGECLQQLAFLWGEPVAEEPPAFAPRAEFHQEFYLRSGASHLLTSWLAGEHHEAGSCLAEEPSSGGIEFVDLTPSWLSGRCYVVRAVSADRLPLTFGYGHPACVRLPPSWRVHPLC